MFYKNINKNIKSTQQNRNDKILNIKVTKNLQKYNEIYI